MGSPFCNKTTSELSTATVLNAGDQTGMNWTDMPLMGIPSNCAQLATSVGSGASSVSHGGNFDSSIGDVVSRSVTSVK